MVQHINIIKYREIPNKFCLTSRLILKLMLIFKLLIVVLNIFGYSIYILDIPQYKITYIYDIIILILGVCSFSLVNKLKFIPITIVALILAVAYSSNVIAYNETTIYNEYTSPDNIKVISKSSGYLFSGKTNYYIKHGFILKNTNQIIELDEGYQQIRNAETEVHWNDDSVTFNYYDSNYALILSKNIEI